MSQYLTLHSRYTSAASRETGMRDLKVYYDNQYECFRVYHKGREIISLSPRFDGNDMKDLKRHVYKLNNGLYDNTLKELEEMKRKEKAEADRIKRDAFEDAAKDAINIGLKERKSFNMGQ